jgi:hypothetical protein
VTGEKMNLQRPQTACSLRIAMTGNSARPAWGSTTFVAMHYSGYGPQPKWLKGLDISAYGGSAEMPELIGRRRRTSIGVIGVIGSRAGDTPSVSR